MAPTRTDADPIGNWLPLALQTADALFPTGSYAHSLGFEECVRLALVRDEATLKAFLAEQIAPALTHFELPYLRLAYDAAQAHDFETLSALDGEIGAAKPARETRAASLSLGRRRLQALLTILPSDRLLLGCSRALASAALAGHHLTICAVQGAVADAPLDAVLLAYFYQNLAAIAGAALKLMRIGQDGVQRALRSANAAAPEAIARSKLVSREQAGCFNPLLEIASMRHEHASERLFIS
jgi:urease accessory protein